MNEPIPLRLASAMLAAFACVHLSAQVPSSDLPHLVTQGSRHALIVDGEPFFILGAQCHNSSAWPASLPLVWPAIDFLHANTLEAPINWEQFEPEPNKFDPTIVDALLAQAREHRVRLVLLWFATWKNGSPHYVPLWMKAEPEKYPRIVGKDGRRVDSPSPHAPATLEADTRAFRELMRHLKAVDPQHTVIMVQVENEPGSWGSVRDFSPLAQRAFEAPVPAELLHALGRPAEGKLDWTAAFGADADEYFQAWSVAHFIGQVAAAGKAEYPLPLYVNVALRDPLTPGPASSYESGGATDNVLAIWKAAAPAIDVLAPDIYLADSARYRRVLELYSRPDNALFVPETRGSATAAKYCFLALGEGAIGWSPFGLDYTRPREDETNRAAEEATLAPVALNYRVLGPIMREAAKLSLEGKLHGFAEETDARSQTLKLGPWQAMVTFGQPAFGYGRDPKPNPEPIGRALIAELGDNSFLVTGILCRIDFRPDEAAARQQREFVRVEEGHFENGVFRADRIWNGDETDWGLNFGVSPVAVRVRLGKF